jgi:ABC-type transport system substrate-binding protein
MYKSQLYTKRVAFVLAVGLLIFSMTMSTGPATVNAQGKYGGTLRVAYGRDVGEASAVLNAYSSAFLPYTSMHTRLITRAPDWTFMPLLAYDWDINDSGRQYVFYLEEGVKFHDGVEMTAEDVIHSFYAIYGYGTSNGRALQGAGLKSITAPDPYTVVFDFENIAQQDIWGSYSIDTAVKPKHIYGAPGVDWDTLHLWSEEERAAYEEHTHAQDNGPVGPIGTGAFKFVEYVSGSYIKFERFDDYWEEGLPYLDDLIFQIISDPQTALLALMNGEIDAIHGASPGAQLPMSQKDYVNSFPEFNIETMSSTGTYHITFNMNPESSPVDPKSAKPTEQWVLDNDVRIAMEYAIDKEAIVHGIYYDLVPAQYTIIPEHIWAYNDEIPHRMYDPELAAKMLDDAGYTIQPDGWRLHNVVFKCYNSLADMGEAVEAYLRDVRIEAISTPIENPVFYEIYEAGTGVGGKYWSQMDELREAFTINSMGAYTASALVGWVYTWCCDNPYSYDNFGHYSNERVDELLVEAVYKTADPVVQGPLYDEIQQIIWEEQPFIFIMPSWKIEAWNTRFTGFNPANRPIPVYGSYKSVYDTMADMVTGPTTVTQVVTQISTVVSEFATIALPLGLVTLATLGIAIRRYKKR